MNETPMHRAHTCPVCNAIIMATPAEFEQRWERHRSEHKAELVDAAKDIKVEDEGLDPGPPAELESAVAKARGLAQTIEDTLKGDEDHLNDIDRHYGALSRIEHNLPQLIDFAFKIANAVGQLCRQKQYKPKALKTGTIYWTPQGDISVEFIHDPYNITEQKEPEYLKRGYKRLPNLHAAYPAVFELAMTLGEHLINILYNRHIDRRDISFTGLHHFENPNNGVDNFAFRVINRKYTLKASRAQL